MEFGDRGIKEAMQAVKLKLQSLVDVKEALSYLAYE